MIDLNIAKESFAQFKQNYRELDKDVQRSIVKGIKGSIGQVTSKMKSEIHSTINEPPMSGMVGNKQNRYRNPNVTVQLSLLAGRGQRVAQIVGRGAAGTSRMFSMVERAGSRSPGFTTTGQRMISVLNQRYPLVKGKGGRALFRSFVNNRTLMHDTVMRELNVLAQSLNVRLRSGP